MAVLSANYDLLDEVSRFRTWATALDPASRSGEWETDYEQWPELTTAVLSFLQRRSFGSWTQEELDAVLYSIARDSECEFLTEEISSHFPELVLPLCRAALDQGEAEAKWQFAHVLGRHRVNSCEVEDLLLRLADDQEEYVRRRALDSLSRLGSAHAERLALLAWNRKDPNQEWARMMVLSCLKRIGSSHLDALLSEADTSGCEHLAGWAERIRNEQDPPG